MLHFMGYETVEAETGEQGRPCTFSIDGPQTRCPLGGFDTKLILQWREAPIVAGPVQSMLAA
jgi:hypothetical protein